MQWIVLLQPTNIIHEKDLIESVAHQSFNLEGKIKGKHFSPKDIR
jgi:hypothetical protein